MSKPDDARKRNQEDAAQHDRAAQQAEHNAAALDKIGKFKRANEQRDQAAIYRNHARELRLRE